MAENTAEYKKFLSALLKKQILMLGPNISLDIVRKIPGITVSDTGEVTDIAGDSYMVAKNATAEFLTLSGKVTQTTLDKLSKDYPTVKY